MLESDTPTHGHDEKFELEALMARILSNEISIIDLLRSVPKGDYWAFVEIKRLFYVLLGEPNFTEQYLSESRSMMVKAGFDPDNDEIGKNLTEKDARRRFSKLAEKKSEAFYTQPSLLTGDTFEGCLDQYKALIGYVEKLWAEACRLYKHENFPLATFFSILIIEEIGKLTNLAQDLIFYDVPRPAIRVNTVERDHRVKHFIGVVSGALINARLDRVLGKDVIRKILHWGESNELEKMRQSCLYIDMKDGRAVTPDECIDAERARVLTVLAGELIAEVLGYFPWEFERLRDNAIAFERAIGMPEKKIAP